MVKLLWNKVCKILKSTSVKLNNNIFLLIVIILYYLILFCITIKNIAIYSNIKKQKKKNFPFFFIF